MPKLKEKRDYHMIAYNDLKNFLYKNPPTYITAFNEYLMLTYPHLSRKEEDKGKRYKVLYRLKRDNIVYDVNGWLHIYKDKK